VAFGSAPAASSLLTQESSKDSLSVLELHAAISDVVVPTTINNIKLHGLYHCNSAKLVRALEDRPNLPTMDKRLIKQSQIAVTVLTVCHKCSICNMKLSNHREINQTKWIVLI